MSLELQGVGGAAAAPGSYGKVGAVSTVKVLSADTVIKAVRMTVQEKIYGVLFSFTVTQAVYNALGWQALASEYAALIQTIGLLTGTQGIQYSRDVNASNQLVDNLIVTVGTDDLEVAVDVTVPLNVDASGASVAKITAAYDAAIAGLVAPV